MPLKCYFYFCGKGGISEDSLIKRKQMSMGSWVKAFYFNLCENCGLFKNASEESDTSISGKCWFSEDSLIKCNKCLQEVGWKLSVLSMWKVRVLRKFRDKMQQRSLGSWVKALWWISVETAGSPKMAQWKVVLLSLQVFRRFLDKMQQMSAGSWVKTFCSISVKSAGFQKMP